ncbi:MAG: hypothetical protein WBV94_03970 [Blastocatellia bacterium]
MGRTNPKALYRHRGYEGHDRSSFHKGMKRKQLTIEEAADRMIADIKEGRAGLAGFEARLIASSVYAIIGRETKPKEDEHEQ